MSTWWTVLVKELVDAFRDRRMAITALVVMPLAVPLVIAGMSSVGMKRQLEQRVGMLELPVIGAEHAPNLVAWLGTHDVRVIEPPADADAAVRQQQHEVILRIDATYAAEWRAGRPAPLEIIFDSSRPLQSGTTVARVRGLLSGYAQQVGTLRLIARGVHPSVVAPVRLGERDVATPESRFDLAQQMLPYLLLLLAFIGGMQLAIDATAGERERQSLEPLLATPASREAIMSGKILATAAFTLLSVLATLAMYRIVFALMPIGQLDSSLAVPIGALGRLLLVVLPVVLLGATVLTALAAFARSYREAQGYLPMLIFLPMLPTLFLMVAPVKTQLWMLAVPFLGQNQLILRILRGEPVTATEWAVNLGVGLMLVVLAWWLAGRLYHREQLAASG
ncbi:MAG: ABC transporter permease [Steroidobacteraceae bacterium]|nr:ABC transporter permease [Steroidobacteraceae bacterium]